MSEALRCEELVFGLPRAWRGLAVAVAVAVAGLLLFGLIAQSTGTTFPLLLWPGLFGAGAAAQRVVSKLGRVGEAQVALEEGGLAFVGPDGRRRWLASDAIVWGARRERTVDFETRSGRRIVARMGGEDAARALLAHTGTAVDQRAMVLPLRGTIGPFTAGFVTFTVSLFGVVPLVAVASPGPLATLLAVPLLCLLIAYAVVQRFFRPHVAVGIDGITIRRVLERRFVPLDAIVRIEHAPAAATDLVVVLTDERIVLPIVGWSAEDVDRVYRRLEEARGRPERAPSASFARRGADVAAWRDHLEGALTAEAGFRRRRIDIDDVEATLADPQAPLEHRLGAALGLRAVEPERARQRIRFAADAALEPTTQRVLLAALEDDAAVEEALAVLEARG